MKTITKPLTFESNVLEVFVATDKPLEGKQETTRDISPWYNPEKDGGYLYYVDSVSIFKADTIQSMVEVFMKEDDK